MVKTLCDVLWVEMEWELGKALSKNKRRKKRESGGEKRNKKLWNDGSHEKPKEWKLPNLLRRKKRKESRERRQRGRSQIGKRLSKVPR